ncbi:hypothetical protein [Fibrobacter sp.]|uniref:hypothetical protein n=1 Tax=Fibrobacter sp. TaxID=35828 RepID=UPI0038705212
MFYKHWKKISLALTGLFWASCETTTTEPPLYGAPPQYSSSTETQGTSSSEAVSSSSTKQASFSSQANASSAEVTCTPGDSIVSYYSPSYSADVAKMNAEERAKRDALGKIDSLKQTLQEKPQCLDDLRNELSNFPVLYGAPVNLHFDEVCSDGTTRPTQEYLDYLKMKEEWERNKPALDEECKRIHDEKLSKIEQRIKKCIETGILDREESGK